jgi:SP family facilitated glucose transporter-like MFS transporter 8
MLQRQDSPFRITDQEASWVVSLLALGAASGGPPFGILMNMVGRKLAVLALSLPVAVGWVLIVCTSSVAWLYIARFLSGLALGGVSFVIPIYIAEIAEPSIRGPLSATMQVRERLTLTNT